MTDIEPVTALTKTTHNGRTAQVIIHQNENLPHHAYTVALLDGRHIGHHGGAYHAAPTNAGAPAQYVAAVGKLLLTQDEADQVRRAYDAFCRDLPANPNAARDERDRLARELDGAREDKRIDQAERWERGEVNPFADDAAHDATIERAHAALSAFDAEHPEVLEQIEAERLAAVDRAFES